MGKVTNLVAGEDAAATDRIVEQLTEKFREHAARIMKSYRKTDLTLAVKMGVSLKGDNNEMSSRVTINFTEEKVSDFDERKIDLKQGSFKFEAGDGPSETESRATH